MATAALARSEAPAIESILIGRSAAMVGLRDMIARVAKSDASILIAGPSGTGKEMVARAIHDASQRSAKPFVAINCGAIPAELIESELFGHERGSFTGAHNRRVGRFEEADGGTLVLDEIGDMRFDMQVKLLRVLEDGIVQRVGGGSAIPVDVRIVSATHQDINSAVDDGRFREDLFFRLGVVILEVPPLAARIEDIPLLVAHFQAHRRPSSRVRFDASGMARLMAHRWPGNVRELRNLVERACVLHPAEMLTAKDVDALLGPRAFRPQLVSAEAERDVPALAPALADPLLTASPINLKELLETMELERIQMALDMADGVISEAARLLTLKRTTLIEKMRKYGVDKSC